MIFCKIIFLSKIACFWKPNKWYLLNNPGGGVCGWGTAVQAMWEVRCLNWEKSFCKDDFYAISVRPVLSHFLGSHSEKQHGRSLLWAHSRWVYFSVLAGYRRARFLWQVFIWQVLYCQVHHTTKFLWHIFILASLISSSVWATSTIFFYDKCNCI